MNTLVKTTLSLVSILLLSSPLLFSQPVPDDPYKVSPLLINSETPEVQLKDIQGNIVSLRKLIAEKPSMLIFYRGGWCPFCNRHLSELQKIEDEILEIGYQILAISVDRPEVLRETLDKNELNYTLLSDSPADVLKAFGLAFEVDQQTVDRYKNLGIDLEANAGYDHHILPVPAVYLIGTDGIVDFQYVNPNYRERIDGDILLTAAKSYL